MKCNGKTSLQIALYRSVRKDIDLSQGTITLISYAKLFKKKNGLASERTLKLHYRSIHYNWFIHLSNIFFIRKKCTYIGSALN